MKETFIRVARLIKTSQGQSLQVYAIEAAEDVPVAIVVFCRLAAAQLKIVLHPDGTWESVQ